MKQIKQIKKTIALPYLLVLMLSCYSHFFFAQSVTYAPSEYENIADFDFEMFLKIDSVQKEGAIYFTLDLVAHKGLESIYNPFRLLYISLWQIDERGRDVKVTLNPQVHHQNHQHSIEDGPIHHHHHLPLPSQLRKTFELLGSTENGAISEFDFIDHNNRLISVKKGVLSCRFAAREVLQEGEILPIPLGQYFLNVGTLVEYNGRDETIHFDDAPVRLK